MKELLNRVAAYLADYTHDTDGMVDELRAAAEQCGEPVAWRYEQSEHPSGDLRGRRWHTIFSVHKPNTLSWVQNITPLYLAPPAQPNIRGLLVSAWMAGKSQEYMVIAEQIKQAESYADEVLAKGCE